jgi:hypothetical protein
MFRFQEHLLRLLRNQLSAGVETVTEQPVRADNLVRILAVIDPRAYHMQFR